MAYNLQTTNILQWNCRGYYANQDRLHDLILNYDPSCIVLQELILGQRSLVSLKGYSSHHSPGRGGAGIFIKRNIPASVLKLRTTLEAVAASLFIGKQYTICSIYIPPHYRITQQEMEELITQLPRPFLILGDFNCRDPLWGDTTTTFPATMIKNVLNLHDIGLLNSGEKTHYHRQTNTRTCIDLSLCSAECVPDFNWQVKTPPPEDFYESDHFPILISREGRNTSFPGPPRYNFKRANWKDFTQLTLMLDPPYPNNVNERLQILYGLLLQAANRAIPMILTDTSKPYTPWWNAECAQAKREKKRASRRYNRTKLDIDWIELQRCRARLRRLIRQSRRSTWKAFVSSINAYSSTTEVWKKIKKISNQYKCCNLPVVEDGQGIRQSDPKMVTEILADSFAQFSSGSTYSNNFKRLRLEEERKQIKFDTTNAEDYNLPFTLMELNSSLSECSDKSSPGEDNISYPMLKHMHPSALQYLLDTFNLIWQTAQFPTAWRQAVVVPIKKPGKTGLQRTDYRPISKTSCTCKVMERMVSKRLSWTLEKLNSLNPMQYGFRQHRSTLDPLLKFEYDVRSAFTRRHMVLGIFFDLEKAYDTTWKRGILKQMYGIGLRGRLPTFISNLLQNRSFKVQIGTTLSSSRDQIEGIPQGSVLGCLCFSLAMNGIKEVVPHDIKHLLYVDDLLIYYEGGYLPTMERRLQHAIDRISEWTDLHGYKFSAEKTKAMLFRHRGTREDPNLSLYGSPITITDNIRYLGLIFDPRLNWGPHIRYLKQSCQPVMSLLACLSHLSWGADRKSLHHIYQALVLSKINYGSQIYASPTCKSLKALEPIQNKCLRLITGAFKSSPVSSLQVECDIPPLEYQRELGISKLFLRLQQIPNSPTTLAVNNAISAQEDWFFTTTASSILGNNLNTNILPTSWDGCPPWVRKPSDVCRESYPDDRQEFEMAKLQIFLEHSSSHARTTHIYTDGSKSQQGVGSGVVIPELNISDSASLPNSASIFTAELYAMLLGLEILLRLPPRNYTIFSDSKSALQSLKQHSAKNAMVIKVKELIHYISTSLPIMIQFCWTPSHTGVKGNELADTIAKHAVTLPIRNICLPFTDLLAAAKKEIRHRWQIAWDRQTENKLHSIKPKLGRWDSSFHKRRKTEVTLARLRIGHCHFSHIHLMLKQDQPQCCGSPLTVAHALVACPRNEQIRLSIFPHWRNASPNERLKELLSEHRAFKTENILSLISLMKLSSKV